MAAHSTFYSSLISGLKILLPLAALALLSTVFLLSRPTSTGTEIPFLDDVSKIPARDSISAPYYSGSTPEGHGVLITAETARPMEDDPEGFVAEALDAVFNLADGGTIHVVAKMAEVNEPLDHLQMTGDVVIESSAGYTVTTDAIISSLRRIEANTPDTVHATGPIGDLTAGQLRIQQGETEDNVQMFFTNGVKLVYEPAKQKGQNP